MLSRPRDLTRILPLGDAAATVAFGDSIDPETHLRVLGFSAQLDLAPLPGVIEWAPAFASAHPLV